MKKFFVFTFLTTAGLVASAQSVAINNDGSLPHPSSMLDVKSANKGVLLPRTSTTTRNTIPPVKGLMVYDTTTNSFWFHNGSSWTELVAGGGSNIWGTNGTNIYNTNTGNIGVGTNSPSYDLHIYRNSPSIGLYDVANEVTSGSITGDSADLVIVAYRKNQLATNRAGNLILQVNSAGLPFVAGNVGIGTYSPAAKLHIASNVMIGSGSPAAGYLLSVNGKIMSEEVRVELDGDWPDYVFKNDYHLPSLSAIEKFIRLNHHLPNIPAAGKVAAEGFDLGDMNKRLLEKIEELTLYLIQLNKEVEGLKKDLKLLKAKQSHH